MPKSDLHTYPKTFNRWGHIKAFPVRKPMHIPFVFILVTGTVWIMGFYMFRSSAFDFFNRADIFQKDKTQLLAKKRSFDTLILGNKVTTYEEDIRSRSIF